MRGNHNLIKITLLTLACVMLNACKDGSEDAYKSMSAEQIYNKGRQAMIKKYNQEAIKDFEALEARYPYGEYTDKGQLAIIAAYVDNEDNGEAIAAADRFIRVHPRHPHVDYAYYMKGVANYNANFSWAFRNIPLDRSKRTSVYAQDSFDAFKLLIEKFPNSRYAADARKRMIVMREQIADHELYIAEYYQVQGADLAAANRAAYIVNEFSRTEAAPYALAIMYQSYKNMKMQDQAAEALATLKANYKDWDLYLDTN
jgi:outer membrane protein assembly factor BamD